MGRVLIVDDDHEVCSVISDILAGAGFESRCVQSDREAYEILGSRPTFNALILDVNLGAGTTGYDIARFARQAMPGLPVIYVSGEAPEASFKAFGVPDSEFVAKPFKPEELLAAIQARVAPCA